MTPLRQVQRLSNPDGLYQEYAFEAQAFCEKALSPYEAVESSARARERRINPLFKAAITKRIIQNALHMMPDEVLEDSLHDKPAFLSSLERYIDIATTEWNRTRLKEYAIAEKLDSTRLKLLDKFEALKQSNDQDLTSYEDVRNAEYIPMSTSDIPTLLEAYDRYVINDETWEMLLEGKAKDFCKRTRSGSFVLRSDETPSRRPGWERKVKKPVAFAKQLEKEFSEDPHPGMLEGRILKSRQSGNMLAGILFRQPPQEDSRESEALQHYLRRGLTGEIHFVGRTRREYLEKIDQILQGELILQNKRFAANRLFHLWTSEMQQIMHASRREMYSILEYQLAHVTMKGATEDHTLRMNGYNDASSLFTAKRGLQVCAYDAHPHGPYVVRHIHKPVQITPAWLLKRGDLNDVQRYGQLEWEETQMIHGDLTEDK